jgi:hypothetical protein
MMPPRIDQDQNSDVEIFVAAKRNTDSRGIDSFRSPKKIGVGGL